MIQYHWEIFEYELKIYNLIFKYLSLTMNVEIKSTTIYNSFRCARYFNIIISRTTALVQVYRILYSIKEENYLWNVPNNVHFNYLLQTRAPCITMCTTLQHFWSIWESLARMAWLAVQTRRKSVEWEERLHPCASVCFKNNYHIH